jgi:hypothetical protein
MNRTMTKGTKIQRRSSAVATASALAAGVTLVLAAPSANAQSWLADRAASEGAGLRVGDFELHPGIGGEAGYDSNWFLRTSKTGAQYANGGPAAPVRDAGEFRITPSLSISTLGSQRTAGETAPPPVIMRADLSATYRAFVGSQEIRDQSSNVSANGIVRVTIAPQRPWSFSVFGSEVRTIQPNSVANAANPDVAYNSDTLGVGGELVSQPHSGTLDMRVGYQLHATLFEDAAGTPYNNLLQEITANARWKFRPQTAFVYEGRVGFESYNDAASQNVELHNSTPIRTKIGITGLVTPRVSALAMVGWGASFYEQGSSAPSSVKQYDSVIANAQISYNLASNPRDEPGSASLTLSSITLGYNRDFQNSFLSDYYGIDRGYLRFSYMFAGRLLLSAEGGVGAIEYPEIFYTPFGGGNGINPIHASFTDARADATAFAEYRFTSSFAVNATFNYTQNFSSTQLPITTGTTANNGTPLVYDMSWQRIQTFLGVRWFL